MDEANDYQNNLSNSVKKISHDSNGNEIGEYIEPDPHHPEDYCGSCYDAQVRNPDGSNMCCNTCSSVFAAYEHLNLEIPKMEDIEQCREEDWPAKIRDHSKEGCRVKGKFQVNKVSGNFHFAPGKSFDVQNYHLHDVRFLEGLKLDFSHKIDYLAFGEYHEKIVNPLDKTENISEMSDNSFKYHIKLVAAEFKSLDGRIINTNQYAVTQSDGDTKGLRSAFPSVFFEYEISPMILIYTEYKRPFSSFLTGLCAIIGGVYTIAAIIDSIVHSAQRRVTKKSNLGKIN